MLFKRKNSNNWYTEFTANGVRYSESTGTTNKNLARAFEEKRRADAWSNKTGVHVDSKMTVRDAIARWNKERFGVRSYTRSAQILRAIKRQDMPLVDFAAHGFRDHVEFLKETRSPTNVVRHVGTVRAMLNDCYHKGDISHPVTVKLPPVVIKFAPNWLTKDQFRTLLDVLPDHCKPIARFAALTGLRWANVAGFKWEWIKGSVAYVPAANVKTKKNIAVPLNRDVLALLEQQKGKHAEYVFTDHWGRAPVGSIKKSFKAAAATIGIPKLRFHDLRHSWASWHLQAGTPLHVLQKLGGWTDYKMIVNVYGHWSTEDLAKHSEGVAL